MENSDEGTYYGTFRIGTMPLALPLAALREVVPFRDACTLPSTLRCVVGAIDLRGTLLPVLDLCRLLGYPEQETPHPIVVVMFHEGRLLGLLAEAACGVVDCTAKRFNAMAPLDSPSGLLSGAFRRSDTGTQVMVLSPASVMAIPDLPLIADPDAQLHLEPDADPQLLPSQSGDGGDSYVLLMRTGPVAFALESAVIYTTLLDPVCHYAALEGGYCLGGIEYAGLQIPVIDLAALCQLGANSYPKANLRQCLVVQYPQGFLAFMVESIMDVVAISPTWQVALPEYALPRQELIAAALPQERLPEHLQHRLIDSQDYYLLLDPLTLLQDKTLADLSLMNTRLDGQMLDALKGAEQGDALIQGKMLTYDVGFEVATPLDHLVDILPWDGQIAQGDGDQNRATSLLLSRGRAISTYCLSRLLGLTPIPPQVTASILVVEQAARFVGFIVPRLITIDDVQWLGSAELTDADRLHPLWDAVRVGSLDSKRMLCTLDLQQLAQMLLSGGPVVVGQPPEL